MVFYLNCIAHSPQGTIRIINENNFNALRTCNFLRNVLQPRAKIPVSNFYSLYSPYQQNNRRATTLKDKYRIKNTRIPSQYNFQLHTKIPLCRPLLAAILFTYSYRDRSTIPNQIHTKSTIFVPPPKSSVHGSGLKPCENNAFPCRSTRGYRYLLSLGEVSKRETSILNLAAGGRRMESFFLSPSRLVSSSFSPHHLSAPVLDLRSTFHRSRRRSSVTRLLPPLPLFEPRLMLSSRLVAFFLGPSLPLSLLFLFPTLMRISIEYRIGTVFLIRVSLLAT